MQEAQNTKVDSDFAMVFTLRKGKVTEFQEFTDSAAVNAAYTVAASVRSRGTPVCVYERAKESTFPRTVRYNATL